ncbi:CU044_5270 family protein [Streptomyces sp. NPDC051940]|uniref:CU044_5270 family protein n=1 Tax=Streptomyces sp. NPDC051940 TaxID=3155675 RepID=UPI00342E4BC3
MSAVPPPPERDLPEGRRHVLREHLMSEILQTEPQPAVPRLRRPAFMAPLLAAALTAAVVAGVTLAGDHDNRPARPGYGTGSQIPEPPTVTPSLPERSLPADPPGPQDDHFIWVNTQLDNFLDSASQAACPPVSDSVPSERTDQYLSVDGKHTGLLRQYVETDGGDSYRMVSETDLEPGSTGFPGTYRDWQKLPATADGMFQYLYEAAPTGESGTDDTAWLAAKMIAERALLAPKEVRVALYAAAARIPGVTLIEDADGGAGRRGPGLARLIEDGNTREELVFEADSKLYYGKNLSFAKDVYDYPNDESSRPCPVQRGFVFERWSVLDVMPMDRVARPLG